MPTVKSLKKPLGQLSLVLLGCCLSGLLAFRLLGSHVDSKGVLREPFFLLPMSAGLGSAGIGAGLASLLCRRSPDHQGSDDRISP